MKQCSTIGSAADPTTITPGTQQCTTRQYKRLTPLLLSLTLLVLPTTQAWVSSRPVASSLPSSVHRKSTFSLSSTVQQEVSVNGDSQATFDSDALQPASDGVYHLNDPEQHAQLLKQHSDKIVILKHYAPWCRACKGLEPKFLQLVHDEKYQSLPIVWAQLSIQNNKDFVKSLGVVALPTIQFYLGPQLCDTFACGPSKLSLLKRKLAQFVNDNVDDKTLQLKQGVATNTTATESMTAADNNSTVQVTAARPSANETMMQAAMTAKESDKVDVTIPTTEKTSSSSSSESKPRKFAQDVPTTTYTRKDEPVMPQDERKVYIESIPFFQKMNLADADAVFDKAKLLSFDSGALIMREGRPGRTFYIVKKGEVEICQLSTFSFDPLTTPSSYLGTVMNRLAVGDYFGERALITGEPRAASIRAASTSLELWAIDQDDFPASSVLSGRTKTVEGLEVINDKYGVTFSDFYANQVNTKTVKDASSASQKRGSVNRPREIRGVDNDETDEEIEADNAVTMPATSLSPSSNIETLTKDADDSVDIVLNLVSRFKLIRLVSRCLEYMQQTRATWGNVGIRNRRKMLVGRLTSAQRDEFTQAFHLIDVSGDGNISLFELKRVMQTIGEQKSDEELMEMIKEGHEDQHEQLMSFEDFMGIMAEAEFYYLFRDIFSSLDYNNSGFVKARDLNRVLCGVRDLVSDSRDLTIRPSRSLIDVVAEDEDMLIDYEQFSKMMLGTTLI